MPFIRGHINNINSRITGATYQRPLLLALPNYRMKYNSFTLSVLLVFLVLLVLFVLLTL
jgi:hypothetical protein